MANRWGKSRSSDSVSSSVPKSLWTVTAAMKSEASFLGSKLWQTYSCIKKQRHHFTDKCPYSQSQGLCTTHVSMRELDHKEGWVPKNWCFQIVVLEKTRESPLDCMEIKPVNPEGDQYWIFIGRTDAEAEAPVLWPPDSKSWLIGKDPDAGKDQRQKEKGVAEDEMVR